jgi:DNA polymerase-3 subunit delta
VLLSGEGALSVEDVEAAVADSARFDVFGLVDAALAGDVPRVTRMLDGLRGEGVEPVLVLWALTRELRSLADMAAQIESGKGIDGVLARVWGKRKGPVRAGLQRHNRARWQQMLRRAARLDRVVKGAATGNAWDELLQLGLLIAGVQLFRAAG